jgi:uncharacterized MAPEG superfamily protein
LERPEKMGEAEHSATRQQQDGAAKRAAERDSVWDRAAYGAFLAAAMVIVLVAGATSHAATGAI